MQVYPCFLHTTGNMNLYNKMNIPSGYIILYLKEILNYSNSEIAGLSKLELLDLVDNPDDLFGYIEELENDQQQANFQEN